MMTRLLLAVLVVAAACETEREVRPVIQTQTVASASCLAQESQTQTVSGVQTAAFANTSLADNTGIDASAAQWRTAAPISIRVGGGANTCFHGGETIGSLPPATSWSAALNYYAVVPDGPNVTVEGVRTFDRGDGVAFGSNAPNWTLRGAYVHYARDGCVENHFVFAGTVDDALLDGCFIGFASRPYRAVADGSGNVMTIQNTLVRLQPMDGVYTGRVPGHGAFFEWSATSPQLALYNNVFRADQPSNDGDEHMAPPPGKLAGCSNNVMVWLGAGAFPEPLPSCFTVMTGATGLDYWNRAVAQWQANHPPALADVGAPVVSLFTPAANATLTGGVTLTATAVDDREVAEVRFQLDGQDLGAAATTDLTPTKYTLAWDSRGGANGAHTLTATARDAAGNATTSAGVVVTISN
ncbi:MAG TPA: Ig-like domain-containing protein [Gemmatimonadales bacterium]|nr:Ig-like domain-containing protein [Gemmatimonadales bacterium]